MTTSTQQIGRLYGVGIGPGDPDLMTVKAVRALENSQVIGHFAKRGHPGNARRIIDRFLANGVTELPFCYPVTTELDRHGEWYRNQIAGFFDEAADAVRGHLRAGRTVSVVSEGDPFFYGSYMHLHVRLMGEFPTEVIPGVTAMSGCWSIAGVPIAQGDDVMMVLPGTLDQAELERRLSDCNAAIIMKVGRNLPKIRDALAAVGRLERAVYVERGTMENGRTMPLAEKPDDAAPYFSLILVPGWEQIA